MRFGLAIAVCCFGACVCAPPIPTPDGGTAGHPYPGNCPKWECPPGQYPGGEQQFCTSGFDCICPKCIPIDAGAGGGGGAAGGSTAGGGTAGGGTAGGGTAGGGCPGGQQFICPPQGCSFSNRCSGNKRCEMGFCTPVCCSPMVCGFIDCFCGFCRDAGIDDEGSPCASTAACSGDGVCRPGAPDAGQCQLACSNATDCGPGQTCSGGYCRPPPEFGVCHYFGGLNHMAIGRYEPATGLCVVIHLAEPMASQLGISSPGGWGVVSARAEYTDGGCPGAGIGGGGVPATSGTGRIDFDGGTIVPPEVAVHATLTFPADSGVPASVALNASGVRDCR